MIFHHHTKTVTIKRFHAPEPPQETCPICEDRSGYLNVFGWFAIICFGLAIAYSFAH